jgi:DNA-binding CsgD family transcriptional regulator/sugar-specific transcriptional regulator TrmB
MVGELTSFGLGEIADALYRAMLGDARLGVAELAQKLGWSPEQVRSGLDELARLSLIRPSSESPGEFRPVPPQVGLSALLSLQELELRQRQDQLLECKTTLEQLTEEYADANRQRYPAIEELTGIDSIRSRIELLASECQSEIVSFAPGGPQSEANLEASKPLDLAVLRRGIRMKTVFQDSVMNDGASAAYANWLVEQGDEVRTTPILPPRMIIYDRSIAILPRDPSDTSAGAVVVRGTGIVAALSALFNRIWDSARPLGRDREYQQGELTGQERVLLQLLAQGYTDEAVARKLGISVRTGRRMTANLTSRLGAKSRFQAGAFTLLNGWLDAADLATEP